MFSLCKAATGSFKLIDTFPKYNRIEFTQRKWILIETGGMEVEYIYHQ